MRESKRERERERVNWIQWFTSLGVVMKHQCVRLSCSWEEVPAFMHRFFPPSKRDCIRGLPVCPLRRGLGRKSGLSHLSHLACQLHSRKSCAIGVGKLKTQTESKHDDKPTVTQKCVWNGRVTNGLATNMLLCPLVKLSPDKTSWWGFVSPHCTDEYGVRRYMLIIYNGWIWSFTDGSYDPIINKLYLDSVSSPHSVHAELPSDSLFYIPLSSQVTHYWSLGALIRKMETSVQNKITTDENCNNIGKRGRTYSFVN